MRCYPPAPAFNPTHADVRLSVRRARQSPKRRAYWKPSKRWPACGLPSTLNTTPTWRTYDAAIARNYDRNARADQTPFLHLSMHLSISEQCSIDQRAASARQSNCWPSGSDSLHDAHHAAMECLGRDAVESQRSGRPPDGNAYIAAVQRRATRD